MPPAPASSRAPLPAWAAELARLWNGGSHSLFLLHGNIFDLFPVRLGDAPDYAPLTAFLSRRLFPDRGCLMFFDIGEGLTFATPAMQTRFFEWLKIYDEVEHSSFHQDGPPRAFIELAPLLRRFFLHLAEEKSADRGATLVISFPEKLVPAAEESSASVDERMALVTLLKWAASPELQLGDVGVMLVTESAAELHSDLVQNPHIASVRIALPDLAERRQFLDSGWI
ncbi:MAG: hypothetical protein ABIZ49_13035, partial [Opitutaceae bacterium]